MILDSIPGSQPKKEMIVPSSRKCPFLHGENSAKLMNYISGKQTKDTLHYESKPIKCQEGMCKGSLMGGQSEARDPSTPRPREEILSEALVLQQQYFASKKTFTPEEFHSRMNEITAQVEKTGSYSLTEEELQFGAKLAWRNASRCIGRIQWNKLQLQDCRNISTTQEMFQALCKHLEYATNGGNIRSMITIFPQREYGKEDFRMWNPQLLNFAGYLQPDGRVIGDPGRVQFTRVCQRLGWKGKGGRFDILPWILSAPGEGPKAYEVPDKLILRVKLEHPRFPWFGDMQIEWYAVPAVADMLLDVGGLEFPAAPFNGWYMGTEIGARNLCDPQRYNITQEVAEKMGLDTSTPISLWKDTVLVEVNVAVLYSFQKNRVTIVDHHTAAETFMKHMETEQNLRGGCPADWVWIVPPISGSITPVYHQEMICYNLKPSYEYQKKAWMSYNWKKNNNVKLKYSLASVAKAALWCVDLMMRFRTSRIQATILYATETGKSETFAHRLESLLHASFNVKVLCMDDYDVSQLVTETLVIVVASTFGSGDPPDNGKAFWKSLKKMKEDKRVNLDNLKYAVFGLGSSQYPTFCYFGKNVDRTLSDLGAQRLLQVELGDELRGQEHTFNQWVQTLYTSACNNCGIAVSSDATLPMLDTAVTWNPNNFRLVRVGDKQNSLLPELAKLHHKKLFPLKMLSRARLQARHSDHQTLLIRLDSKDASTLSYEPGDHIGVFPKNPSHVVDAVLARLSKWGKADTDVVRVELNKNNSWKPVDRLPPSTLRTYLSSYLDITTPPSPHILQLMSEMATNQWDKYRLKRLATVTDDYEEWKSHRYPDLAEFLEEFPSIQLEASLLISELPLLQPRYYSISSTPRVTPNEVHLTLTLVSYRTQDNKGPMHHGVCTSYLNNFPEGDILCFIRSAPNFRLPNEPSVPVIMVGAGSGIAPFRSFWQQRDAMWKQEKLDNSKNKVESLSARFGPMVLFFGCRQAKVDNIYEQETAPLVRKGVLSKVFTALSREPGKPKCYVQDELMNQSDLVHKLLSTDGHIYVCGDAVMAAGVRAAVEHILLSHGNRTLDVESLTDNGRYHEDVFGILHRK